MDRFFRQVGAFWQRIGRAARRSRRRRLWSGEPLERRDLLASVSVTGHVLETGETSPSPAIWKISRTPADAGPLTVQFTVHDGTAVAGQDYVPVTATSVTIPPYQQDAFVEVYPLDDPFWEPTESVLLTIQLSAAYTIGVQSAAVGIVSDDVIGPMWLLPLNIQTCSCSCGCENATVQPRQSDGELALHTKTPGLNHSAVVASGQATVSAEARFTTAGPLATGIELKVTRFGGEDVDLPAVYYSPQSVLPGETYRFEYADAAGGNQRFLHAAQAKRRGADL